LLEKLDKAYDLFLDRGFTPILKQWKGFACFLGSEVEVIDAEERYVGTALDVDDDGSLVLRFEDGSTRRVLAGDVSVRIACMSVPRFKDV
jgi:BirA family biotin operon repressor/biotin-[acetyl-CoA-carboxylase] ligase